MDGLSIGFTGTSLGASRDQLAVGRRLLNEEYELGARIFRHGCCVGADEEFARIARETGYEIVGYPGRPVGDPMRSTFRNDYEFLVPTGRNPELKRNRRIVASSSRLLAAPRGDREVVRSGTWSTVRYARKTGVPVDLIGRDGRLAA